MPYYGDGAPYSFYTGGGGAFANHSSLMTGINRYHNPIAARYSPHLSTISESPFVTLRRFSPAVSTTTSHTTSLSRPRRIIDTADIDVSKPPRTLAQENRPQRHRLRRDRPTIKIRSQALKDNPALREYNERHEKTVGELLVEKFLIKDKGERKMKLYHQPSLMGNDKESEDLTKERENEILAAIRRRVTRRMTRRRSSADVLPLDPEQIEREAALQAAQAEALDSLVAEEQAEIEVEVRRGTFAKRQAMRLPLEISEVSETEEDDELDEEERKGDGSKKHATTKKKKRRKSLDKLSVKSDDEDELEIPESVIEEEEFEWDDREKCDDVRSVLPVESEAKVSKKSDAVAPKEPVVSKPEKVVKAEVKAKEQKKTEEKADKTKAKEAPPKDEKPKSKDKKPRDKSPNRLKRTISAPQPKPEEDEPTPRFKVEACNSVGDFSTLYVKAAADNSRSIEQFRESIRLPAPRQRVPASNIETEVVLPVRKPYVRDTSRNSVYLALKPSQAKKTDDGYSSIIIDEPLTNKESAAESRPAKCAVIAADRSKIESASEPIIREEREQRVISEDAVAAERGAVVNDSAAVDVDKKKEPEVPLVEDQVIVKKSAGRGGEEFVSWWDETDETAEVEVKVKPKIEAAKSEIKIAEKVPAVPDKVEVAKSVETKVKSKVESSQKPEASELKPKVEVADKSAKIEKPVEIKEKVSKPEAEKVVQQEEKPKPQPVPKVEDAKKATSPIKESAKEVVASIEEKKPTSPVKTEVTASIPDKKPTSPVKKEVVSIPEKKPTSPIKKEVVSILEKKPASPVKKEVDAIPEKKPTSPVKKEVDAIPEKKRPSPIKEVPSIPEKKPTSTIKDSIKEVVSIPEKKSASPIKEAIKEVPVIPDKKPTSPIKDSVKEVTLIPETKPTSPIKDSVKEVPSIPEKKPTSPIKDSVKEAASIPEKKLASPVKDSIKEVPAIPEKKSETPIIDSVKEVASIPEKKLASPVKDAIKEVSAVPEKKPESPIIESIKEVPSIPEKKPTSPIKDLIKEVPATPEKKSTTLIKDSIIDNTSTAEKKPISPIKDSIKEAAAPKPSVPEKKSTNLIKDTPKEVPAKILEKKLVLTNDIIKTKFDLPRDHYLPRIPEEPKSASPEKQQKIFPSKPIEPVKKDKPKKKVDSEAIMKIEKKILEDSESPDKIVTGAIPEPVVSSSPVTKKEPKVGLATKKKNDATAPQPEIDFWSEIQAEESSVKVTPKKVQSHVDEQLLQSRRHSPENLKLDLSKIDDGSALVEDLTTPLVEDLNKTPLVEEPSTPLVENLSEVPLENLQLENRVPNGEVEVPAEIVQEEKKEERPETRESVIDPELSGTVKKISKWANQDNLNEADKDATPIASKEVSPQASAASSTTKKKVVKRKKSTATPKKKASEKGESTKTKKAPVKKVAASPQTSQLKTAMSASGSPRNTPGQRPPDLMKMFYTTPAILLTATPRDLRKVRRAKVKRKKPPTRTPSLSSDSTGSTRSTATTSTEEGSNCEEDEERKRLASTRSNDSGFDGSPRLSNCDMVCHKKCEKLTGNLCGLNQKLVAEALQALKKAPSQSSENQRNADGEHYHHSGRITPPATNLPRFKKYEVTDFNFLKVLGKGSFGKVLLAELRGTECVYAVKCLKKDVVLEDDDVECTLIERKVLTLATRHPYLCHLFCTFQTESHLFFVMEYLNGGDLMFHIQKSGRFSEQRSKFYAAEIWSGLIFLHKKGIVYRDLKLDNVLLDFEGHIRIADFGMCKLQIFLDRTADTFCGTPDYMAPEIIKGLKYNQAVDWWSFGVLLYEMLTGQSPFSGCDEDELFWSICNERPFIPRYLSQSATDILVCLLEKDAGKRIPGHQIACHPFFCTIAWDKLERRSMDPPFKPAVEHTLDTRYFDTAFTTERPRLTPVPEQILTSMDQAVFRGFSYTNPNATD